MIGFYSFKVGVQVFIGQNHLGMDSEACCKDGRGEIIYEVQHHIFAMGLESKRKERTEKEPTILKLTLLISKTTQSVFILALARLQNGDFCLLIWLILWCLVYLPPSTSPNLHIPHSSLSPPCFSLQTHLCSIAPLPFTHSSHP